MGAVMNFISFFNTAISYNDYLTELDENLPLHELHYKRFVVDPELQLELEQKPPVNILVVSESWCGDSLALLPIIYKMSEFNSQWEVRIIHRDEHPDLMDNFETNGTRGIPVFLFLNLEGDLLFRWGPRPKAAQKIFNDHRHLIQTGEIEKKEVIKKIRNYYSKDHGQETSNELRLCFKENFRNSFNG
jgi:thiol-disulfide isomerase/thioredoxin